MALFLAIVASHLTDIARSPLFFTLNGIFSYCRGGVFFLFEPFPLFLFVIGLGRLIGTGRSRDFAVSQLCFVGPRLLGARLLGSGFLGLHL